MYEIILNNVVATLDAKELTEKRGGARVTDAASVEQMTLDIDPQRVDSI